MSIDTGFRCEKLSGALVYYQFAAFLFIFSEKKERTFNAGVGKEGNKLRQSISGDEGS